MQNQSDKYIASTVYIFNTIRVNGMKKKKIMREVLYK